MSGPGFASGSARNIALLEVRGRVPVAADRLGKGAARLLAGRDRGQVVPELPVALVLLQRLSVVVARRRGVSLLSGDVAEEAPRVGRPPPPGLRLPCLGARFGVVALREGPVARGERARADHADEGDYGKKE